MSWATHPVQPAKPASGPVSTPGFYMPAYPVSAAQAAPQTGVLPPIISFPPIGGLYSRRNRRKGRSRKGRSRKSHSRKSRRH